MQQINAHGNNKELQSFWGLTILPNLMFWSSVDEK